MRRYRRLVVINRLIPFLAAVVGLISLAGAVVVQFTVESRTRAVSAEIAALKSSVEAISQQAVAPVATTDDGTVEALLALQERMNRLESDWQNVATAAPATAPAAVAGAQPTPTAEIDPSLPTTDCIPLGTRFMVTPNETYPLCQSREQVKVGGISADIVEVNGVGISSTGFGTLPGTTCTAMVFSADPSGFAEMRVTCV
jgi:hypothetical protein